MYSSDKALSLSWSTCLVKAYGVLGAVFEGHQTPSDLRQREAAEDY